MVLNSTIVAIWATLTLQYTLKYKLYNLKSNFLPLQFNIVLIFLLGAAHELSIMSSTEIQKDDIWGRGGQAKDDKNPYKCKNQLSILVRGYMEQQNSGHCVRSVHSAYTLLGQILKLFSLPYTKSIC